MEFKTAGYSQENRLTFDLGIVKCGRITNGVSFAHDGKGSWVMAFRDLEKAYSSARMVRLKKTPMWNAKPTPKQKRQLSICPHCGARFYY